MPEESAKRYAPATLRNREPIRDVLRDVLPERPIATNYTAFPPSSSASNSSSNENQGLMSQGLFPLRDDRGAGKRRSLSARSGTLLWYPASVSARAVRVRASASPPCGPPQPASWRHQGTRGVAQGRARTLRTPGMHSFSPTTHAGADATFPGCAHGGHESRAAALSGSRRGRDRGCRSVVRARPTSRRSGPSLGPLRPFFSTDRNSSTPFQCRVAYTR